MGKRVDCREYALRKEELEPQLLEQEVGQKRKKNSQDVLSMALWSQLTGILDFVNLPTGRGAIVLRRM
jgi:hypothetical protein